MKLFLIIGLLSYFSACQLLQRSATIESRVVEQNRTFYKVTNRALSCYFKNPADTALLGNVVPTGLLTHDKFSNDTLQQFLLKIDLCNDDLSAQVYIPCNPHFIAIMRLNEQDTSNKVLIGYSNHLQEFYYPPHEEEDYTYTNVYVKNEKTQEYEESMYLSSRIIGYYIDTVGNKILVVYTELGVFGSKDNTEIIVDNTTFIDSVMILYKWKNQRYVPDSLLTIGGKPIPKEEYEKVYRSKVSKIY
jgi:hypothetical protein